MSTKFHCLESCLDYDSHICCNVCGEGNKKKLKIWNGGYKIFTIFQLLGLLRWIAFRLHCVSFRRCHRRSTTRGSVACLSNWARTSCASLGTIPQHASARLLLVKIRIRILHVTFAGRLVRTGHVRLRVQVVMREGLYSALHDQIRFTLDSTLRDRIEIGEAISLSTWRQLNWWGFMRKGWVCRTTTMFGSQSFNLLMKNKFNYFELMIEIIQTNLQAFSCF